MAIARRSLPLVAATAVAVFVIMVALDAGSTSTGQSSRPHHQDDKGDSAVSWSLWSQADQSHSEISQEATNKDEPISDKALEDDGTTMAVMNVSRCGCSKMVPSRPMSDKFLQKFTTRNTTCEADTWVRGAGQKVVAFTYYAPMNVTAKAGRNYFEGIRENLKLVQRFYPGWVMRLYYDVHDSAQMRDLCELACAEPMFDMCDANHNARLGNASILYPLIWRFLPVIDIQVSAFLSRDLDSRISEREVSAVSAWLASDKDVHVMRDHPAHAAYMLGGTWGARLNNPERRKQFLEAFRKLFKDGLAYAFRTEGGPDQVALTRFVWPWAKRVAMSHDAYSCYKYPRTSPFPTQRIMGQFGNYVGSVVTLNASLLAEPGSECSPKCRPKDHPDWIYC